MNSMVPNKEVLKKYADVLIKCALNKGVGAKPGEVILLQVPECAKPILIELRRSVLEAGAHPIINYLPDDMSREFFEIASEEQLTFFPDKMLKGKLDQVDHIVSIIAETNKKELVGIDPKKIMGRQSAFKPYMEWREKKENDGKLFWTLGLYGTQEMADEVNMTYEEYWGEIIKACYLDLEDPVLKWREIIGEIDRLKDSLNKLDIDYLRVEAEKTDIIIGIGDNRKWLGGNGHNIPSFEVFISPDFRRTQGHIQFTEPLYVYGNLIEDVYLEFKDGVVVNYSASKGEDVLKEMISVKNANKIGEFSLTDGRMSKITKYMGETLFDENVGGEQGNTHLALGMAYKDSCTKDISTLGESDFEEMGFNSSVVHTDIVATSKRKVTATLKNGQQKVIYEGGQFLV